jgi:hypothetical protein
MTKSEIINQLAIERKVEELISNITKAPPTEGEEDLAQDIYLALLEKNDRLIEQLYKDNQLIYFITRMLINNLRSKTSPYYYKYKRYENNKTNFTVNEYNTAGSEDDM